MGRAKQNMKLITEGRTRNITFRKRKEGLKKKARELKVLCDVEVCLIIYGPTSTDETASKELEIWPSNPDSVQSLIDSYKNQSNDDRNRRTDNLFNFFEKKRQNIENDLLKLRKKNEMAKFATWDERYENLSYEELRQFESLLDAKVAVVKNKIETITSGQNCSSASTVINNFMVPQHQPISSSFNPSEITFPVNYYPFNQTQHRQEVFRIEEPFMPNHPLMIMPPQQMNNNNCDHNILNQFGGIYGNNLYTRGCFDDTTLGNFSTPRVGYFGSSDSDTQMMTPYMQYMKMEEDNSVWYEQMMKNQNRNQA